VHSRKSHSTLTLLVSGIKYLLRRRDKAKITELPRLGINEKGLSKHMCIRTFMLEYCLNLMAEIHYVAAEAEVL
jgi:hypothetical protein